MIELAPTKMIQEANISGNRDTRIPSPDLKRPGSAAGRSGRVFHKSI
jgi:hypothetical protein